MNARNDAKRRVNASLMNIHRELFGEKLYDLSDTAYSDKPLEKVYLPVDEEGRKSVVEILCSLYFRKHDQTGNASQKEDDLEYLRELCIALGLDGILETEFNNFNILYASNIYDSNRIPTAIYNIYHEIQTGLNIDTSYAREMETRFAEYVPNLDTQKAARTAGKGLGAAGFAVAGVITENPLLLQTSAAMAASAIDDMSGETKTKIGNCLKIAVGEELPENGIRKCLDEAVKYRKEINGD